ncbi:MAG: cupin domain-containing protein [Candidatus Omnitrophica bacterium]|nr:cupin domain-containing protein [Candidatus Omnitrophota bacterium]
MIIKKLNNLKEFEAGDGCILREFFNPCKDNIEARYSLAHAKVLPGQHTKDHRLNVSELYYILKGKGLMHIDDERANVYPDDAVYIPPNSIQSIENTGKSDLEFICIVDPAWKPEDEEII